MARGRRCIFTNCVYEICIRTRQGLPFVTRKYMKMLLRSVMARVQRDQKVIIIQYTWMANHLHMMVIVKDRAACTQFYGELQKQLTESLKKLLGLRHLTLWKSNVVSVIPLEDVATIQQRLAYFAANPASADLVDSIEDYPGLSTYWDFMRDLSSVDAAYSIRCPWVRLPMIGKLKNLAVSDTEDLEICAKWESEATEFHDLVVQPHAWMKLFGIERRGEVRATNRQIISQIKELEERARVRRKARNKKIMTAEVLRQQALNMTYEPEKPTQRIYVYSVDPGLLSEQLRRYQEFNNHCVDCYERWRCGDLSVEWPLGAFRPPIPNLQNDLFAGDVWI